MLSSDETKSGGKPNQRKGKPAQANKKGEQRKRKPAQPQEPLTEQPREALAEQPKATQAEARPQELRVEVDAEEPTAPVRTADSSAADDSAASSPAEPTPSAEIAGDTAVSYRTIADVWGNYSRTSLEQTRAYFEKLAGVNSLGAAFEVQAEFAKQACETFVAQSQRIGELQGELAKQRMKRFEGFMQKMTQVTRRS